MTRKLALTAAVVLALGGMAVGGVARADIDPIQTRQTGLDLLAGTLAGIKVVVTTNGDVKTLEGPAKAIARWGKLFPTLFPAGSDQGTTKASPKIWTDQAGFQKAAMNLSSAAETLEAAAKSGDAAATTTAFKGVADACGACHKEYRLK